MQSASLPCGRKKQKIAPNADSATTSEPWRPILNNYLKQQGLRATPQREKVAEVALSRKSHFEIQTLIKEIQERFPEISPATVYRSVKTLCEAGLLSETLQNHTGVTLYEAHDDEHHDHIVCLDCGEIFEFHDEGMELAQTKAIEVLGFEAARHKHVIYAKCAYLAKKNNK
jgi:Fur family ferric uptake transcriptional regulator